jgi:hypothetical protein
MGGKFEIEDFKNAYDSHGENMRPSNYSWTAVRLASQPQGGGNQNPGAAAAAKNSAGNK